MENPARVRTLTIGRAPENDITISDHRISRNHARLEILGGGQCSLEDLNSTNGTYVNGNPISRQILQPGDRVELAGDVAFQWYKYLPTQQAGHRRTRQMEGRNTQPKGRNAQHLDDGSHPPHQPPQPQEQERHNGSNREFRPGMQTQQYLSGGQTTVVVGVVLRFIVYILALSSGIDEFGGIELILMGVWAVLSLTIINHLYYRPLKAEPWLIVGMIFYGLTISIVTLIGVIVSYNKIRTIKKYPNRERN